MLSAAHYVSGSRYNDFDYLLDHPNAGEEPSNSGTESRKVEKLTKYDRKQISNPLRQLCEICNEK
jgi:hypothetical protein